MDHHMMLKAVYQQLLEHQRLFAQIVQHDAQLQSACVYTYPNYTDKDIGKPVNEIPITPYRQEAALSRAINHLFVHKLDQTRSGRLVKRLPGTVVLQYDEPSELLQRMHTINGLKNQLHQLITQLSPDLKQRHDIIKHILPDLVKIMAYRDILFANKPLISVGFTWKHRQSSKTMGKSALMQMLQKTAQYFKTHQPAMNKHQPVEEEIALISKYPASTRFSCVRPLRVSPAMNLRYVQDTDRFINEHKAPIDMVAHSPLWIVNQHPKIHSFHSYTAQEDVDETERHSRGSKYTQLVIPRLHIYLKE
jgi:DNA replication terminus site-binding protein